MAKTVKHKSATSQDSKPGSYSIGVKLLCMIAFLYAISAYLNESIFHWYQLPDGSYPFWLSHWTEYIIIVLFGVWRTIAEKNPYTRKRLAVLTAMVGILWWLVPSYLRIPEPYIGSLPKVPIFPHLHTPGTLTFFVVLLLVFLFGRQIICGWCCPCVGIRETVGFPFRINTIRTEKSRRYYRHIKWIFFILYLIAFVLIIVHSTHTSVFYKTFLGLVAFPYFLTLILSPILGNRSYCRFICPYGATFGLLNRIGFFGIHMDKEKCSDCMLCEKVCDMGIPVWSQGTEHGKVVTIEECSGCARCVVSCPKSALELRDVRNVLKPTLRRDKNYLVS